MKRLFSIKYTDNAVSFAMLVLRVVFGGLIITHGYDKLMHFGSGASTFPDFYHIGHTTSMALSIFAEFFCGVFILIGLFTRFACIPLIINMGTALYFVHNTAVTGKGEIDVLYLAAFFAILIVGPGKLSLDKLIGK